jgi:threonine dehydratase
MTVQFSDILDARQRLDGVINPTPILSDKKLSDEIGCKAFLKAECLQRGGSFKVRGAYNKISQLTDDEKKRGVITASAGNHAQGVALAAQMRGIKATIVLPEAAPLTKVTATKARGAEVILKGGSFDEAVAYSRELEKERGSTYVHAFEDDLIIAGQGTIGCEIAEDLPSTTLIVVPIGGGGIISGIALAAKTLIPDVRIAGVQAENVSAVIPSLEAGKPLEVKHARPTIADGIAVKRPGERTLPMIREYVDQIVTVSEEDIGEAIFHCMQDERLVVEGAGAAGVAALLAKKIDVSPDDVVCAVLCGGNIDANLLALVLERVMVKHGRYVIFKLLVIDRPGALAQLLNHAAEAGANVIEVFHRRAMWLAPIGYTGIELLLEVRDETHGQEVEKYLESAGYHLKRQGQGDWEI